MANYIQKEKEFLKVLRDTDYEFYDGNKDDALDYLGSALSSFPEYENSIINQKKLGPVIREQYEGQEVRDRISELDAARRVAHDMAIARLDGLNRIFKIHGLEPFADIDTEDRYTVAGFCADYVNEIYGTSIKRTPDGDMPEFSLEKIHDQIHQIDEEIAKEVK